MDLLVQRKVCNYENTQTTLVDIGGRLFGLSLSATKDDKSRQTIIYIYISQVLCSIILPDIGSLIYWGGRDSV